MERFGSRLGLGDPAQIRGQEGPKSLSLSDLDGDGRRDIVAGNLDGTVSIAYGLGELEFEPTLHLQTGALTLRGLYCGDFNGDSRPDVAVAAPEEGEVFLFFNRGFRKFSEPQILTVWRTIRNLTGGDFNGDGHLDLAVAGREKGLRIYTGDGTGDFQPGLDQKAIAIDSDDGYKPVYSLQAVRPFKSSRDYLIVAHSESPSLGIVEYSPFVPRVLSNLYLDHRPHSMEVGVVETDDPLAAPNLITADKRLGTIIIHKAVEPSAFQDQVAFSNEIHQTIHVPGAPRAIGLRDLNEDGWNDLVVVLRNFDRVLTYENKGGHLEPVSEVPVGKSPRELAFGDLDGNSQSDLVVINRRSQDASVLLTSDQGNGFSVLDQIYPVVGEVAALELHDINDDGRSDVLQLHRASGDVSVRLAGSDGRLSSPTYYPMGVLPSGFELKDLNHDGMVDLLAANLGRTDLVPGAVSIRYGKKSGRFGERVHIPVVDGARIFAVESADFDSDGIEDFAVGYFDCRIGFYQGQEDGSYIHTRTDRFTYESRVMVTGDFDQDGDIDIAGAGYAGDVVVLENEGDLLTNRNAKRRDYPPRSFGKFGTREIEALDVNSDGDLDLLVGSGNGVLLLTGGAGTSFEAASDALKGTEFRASSLTEADFDDDGINDLAVSCRVLSCVVILKGDGSGGFDPALFVDVPAGEPIAIDISTPDILTSGNIHKECRIKTSAT
ncbi:MAG: VCBS repeat-containing protein, partial [Verrucomicrobiota bacterium]